MFGLVIVLLARVLVRSGVGAFRLCFMPEKKDQAKIGWLLYTMPLLIKAFNILREPIDFNSFMSSESNTFSLSFNSARFLQSASKLSNSPAETEIEIAFAGRSNAGKSSAINALCNNKKLARTSKTPGRTQLINFFSLSDARVRFVDLPGYGYAKVSLDLKEAWGRHLDDYLQNRTCLSALVLIMDIRKPLTDFDRMLLDWSHRSQMPTLILLTKADKLKRGAAKQAYFKVVKELEAHDVILSVQLFSSLNKDGVEASRQCINRFCEARLSAPE